MTFDRCREPLMHPLDRLKMLKLAGLLAAAAVVAVQPLGLMMA